LPVGRIRKLDQETKGLVNIKRRGWARIPQDERSIFAYVETIRRRKGAHWKGKKGRRVRTFYGETTFNAVW